MGTILNFVQTVQLKNIQDSVDTINNKLGAQLPDGGVSGFLKKFWNIFNLQRIINLLTFITVLHNAFMLSSGITQTLFGAFDNILSVFGAELKDADGNEIDTQNWVGQQIEGFFNGIFGAETGDEIQAAWANFNRIYQAAMNLLNAVRSMIETVFSALEVIGSWIAKIGNALRKVGTVADSAYRFMNPQPNFHNRFFTSLERVQDIADSVETITGNVRDIGDQWNEMVEARQQLDSALEQATGQLGSANLDEKQHIREGLPAVPVDAERATGEPREIPVEQLGRQLWEVRQETRR